jgi:hypothetical protein
MVVCGSYIFELSVSKDMGKKRNNTEGGSRKGSGTFMSNTH